MDGKRFDSFARSYREWTLDASSSEGSAGAAVGSYIRPVRRAPKNRNRMPQNDRVATDDGIYGPARSKVLTGSWTVDDSSRSIQIPGKVNLIEPGLNERRR